MTGIRKKLLAAIVGMASLAVPVFSQADTESDFAATERDLAAAAAEASSLAAEVRVLDRTAEAKTAHLADVERKVRDSRKELVAINADLTNMHRDRVTAEQRLRNYVRLNYMQRMPSQFSVIASDRSLTQNLLMLSYFGSLQEFAQKTARQLGKVEGQIAQKQQDAQQAYRLLDELEAQARTETAELNAVRAGKARLLAETQGSEAAYRRQYETLREQLERTGNFARDARSRIGSRVWDESGYYFNQLDSRWIDATLGFSSTSTIGDYGCGVTSLAMVFKKYGIGTDPPALNDKLKRVRAFVGDLMDWRNTPAASDGQLVLANNPYPVGRGNVDWGLIDRQLAAGHPVIVFIDRPGQISHYVVLIERRGGDYLMHDSIEGPYLKFGDYYQAAWIYQFITFRPA